MNTWSIRPRGLWGAGVLTRALSVTGHRTAPAPRRRFAGEDTGAPKLSLLRQALGMFCSDFLGRGCPHPRFQTDCVAVAALRR